MFKKKQLFKFRELDYNGPRLAKGADFHHQCQCGEQNRHFCQTVRFVIPLSVKTFL